MHFKVPKRNVIVVHVVVQIDQARVDCPVCLQDWSIGKVDTAWDCSCVRPHTGDLTISDHDVALVEHIVFAIHGHNSSFQQEGII